MYDKVKISIQEKSIDILLQNKKDDTYTVRDANTYYPQTGWQLFGMMNVLINGQTHYMPIYQEDK